MRPFPKQYDIYLKIANDERMTFPRGRALYVCNRIANGDWFYKEVDTRETHLPPDLEFAASQKKEVIKRMLNIKVSTAVRWYEHWLNGGHIKSLRSREEQNKIHAEARRKTNERMRG